MTDLPPDWPIFSGRLTTAAEYRPFMDAFMDELRHGRYEAHDSYPPIFADWLAEQNDPRHILLRREPGLHHTMTWVGERGYHLRDDHRVEGDWGSFRFSVVAKSPYRPNSKAGRKLVTAIFFPQSDEKNRYRAGLWRESFTSPIEAHALVDLIPDEAKQTAARKFLTDHFGPRPTNYADHYRRAIQ